MKIDHLGCVVREKPRAPQDEIANLGDSCAETARALIFGRNVFVHQFIVGLHDGYVRHPDLVSVEGWGVDDMSSDQALPLLMAFDLNEYPVNAQIFRDKNRWRIAGTKTFLSVGLWALVRKQFWLLNLANVVQGWLFNLSWRFGDGGKLERSEGKVQDFLNYIVTYVYLRKMGKRATLNQSMERCLRAVETYYLKGDDHEPTSEWVVELYRKALEDYA